MLKKLKLLKKPFKETMVMRFPAKKRWPSLPPSGCLGTPLPLPQSLCGRTDVRMYGRTDGRSCDCYVTTKISRIDRLPDGSDDLRPGH